MHVIIYSDYFNYYPHTFLDLTDPVVTVTTHTTRTAGDELQLSCTVTTVENLVASSLVTVLWSGGSVGSNEVTESTTTISGVTSMRTLIFNPLLTSHGAEYTCHAMIIIPSINVTVTSNGSTNVTVQSK